MKPSAEEHRQKVGRTFSVLSVANVLFWPAAAILVRWLYDISHHH